MLALGCAPGNPGLNILFQVAPTDECVVDPNAIERIVESRLDLDPLTPMMLAEIGPAEIRPAYIGHYAVNNNLINRFNSGYPLMGDTNDVTVTSAEVELLDTSGRRLPGGFYRARASGAVESALGDQPGRGLVRIDVVPNAVVDTLTSAFVDTLEGDGSIVARVVLIGVTQAGTEVRSYPYAIPIDLCYGCLYVNRTLEPGQPNSCTPGQDTVYALPGFSRTSPCVDSGQCSTFCVLGHCARDLP